MYDMQSNHKAHNYQIWELSWYPSWMLLAKATVKAASPQGARIQYQDDLI